MNPNLIKNALTLCVNGDNEAAVAEVDKLLKQYGNEQADLYDIRAMSLFGLGYYLDAIDDYTKYLSFYPECANVYFLRSTAYSIVGEYVLSKMDLEKAVKLNPNEQLYQSHLCNIRFFTDDPFMMKMAANYGVDSKKLVRRNIL
jgi:tetratricopeptide (TPR) repeat protein